MMIFMLFLMMPFASASESSSPIDLNMMNQSVDDMYTGYIEEMEKKVQTQYFNQEIKKNQLFRRGWQKAESRANNKYNKRKDKKLTKNHIQAICVYTNGEPNVYELFNNEVRKSFGNYKTVRFQFHALHFWLTSAIQILAANKPCRTTYRRSKNVFKGNKKQEFRFGSFTSSSKNPNLLRFGEETCFHIETCYGAYIKDYSVLAKHEQEVLIPPYEVFKITEIVKNEYGNLTDCKNIFVVKSTRYLSNLNCKAA